MSALSSYAEIRPLRTIIVPLSIVLVALIVAGFLWAVRSGQFEDLEGPAHRILMDDDDPPRWRDDGDSKDRDAG